MKNKAFEHKLRTCGSILNSLSIFLKGLYATLKMINKLYIIFWD